MRLNAPDLATPDTADRPDPNEGPSFPDIEQRNGFDAALFSFMKYCALTVPILLYVALEAIKEKGPVFGDEVHRHMPTYDKYLGCCELWENGSSIARNLTWRTRLTVQTPRLQ